MTEPTIQPLHGGRDDADAPEHQAIAARIADAYRALPDPSTAQVDGCTRAVLAAAMHQVEPTPFGTRRIRWWWGAATGLAAAAALVFMVRNNIAARGAAAAASTPASVEGAIAADASGTVRFDLRLPATARNVAVVGDFNDWRTDATPMTRRAGARTWSAQVQLTPGRHAYAFVVDGTTWVIDPLAPQAPDNGYGPSNAIVVETLPGALP